MKNRIVKLILLSLVFVLIAGATYAQCPMCRAAAEGNLQNGGA